MITRLDRLVIIYLYLNQKQQVNVKYIVLKQHLLVFDRFGLVEIGGGGGGGAGWLEPKLGLFDEVDEFEFKFVAALELEFMIVGPAAVLFFS